MGSTVTCRALSERVGGIQADRMRPAWRRLPSDYAQAYGQALHHQGDEREADQWRSTKRKTK